MIKEQQLHLLPQLVGEAGIGASTGPLVSEASSQSLWLQGVWCVRAWCTDVWGVDTLMDKAMTSAVSVLKGS